MNNIATILLIIGGLNWGLVGFFNYDLVAALFGGQTGVVSRIIYALVGLSALYEIFALFRNQRTGIRSTEASSRIDRAA